MTPTRLSLRGLAALAALALFSACPAPTWQSVARDAAATARDPGASAQELVHAAELALVVDHDRARSVELLARARKTLRPGSPLALRAALLEAHLAIVDGVPERLLPAVLLGAGDAPAEASPPQVEAIVGTCGLLWGQLPKAPVPPELKAALEDVASRPQPAWEPARTEAREQLVTASFLDGTHDDRMAAMRRAGVVQRWKLSAPWGEALNLDMDRVLGPETRALRDREVVGTGFERRPRPTWSLDFSDGEVVFLDLPRAGGIGFAEAWIALPEGAADRRVVVRLESNRDAQLWVGDDKALDLRQRERPGPWRARAGVVLGPGSTRLLVKMASETGSGFARVTVQHITGGDVDLAASPGTVASPAGRFEPPPSYVETFAADPATGASQAAIEAMHRLEALIHRPIRDHSRAAAMLERLRASLGAYPGLALAEASVALIDPALDAAKERGVRRQALEVVRKAWPDDVRALRGLAAIAFDEERLDHAWKLWNEALERQPKDLQALIGLLGAYSKKGWEPQALDVVSRLVPMAGAGPRVLQEIFDVQRRFRRTEEAVRSLEELDKRFPVSALARKATLAGDLGMLVERAGMLVEQWRREPERLSLLRSASEALRAAGEDDAARKLVDRMLAIRPEDPWALSERVRMAIGAGDRKAADEALDAVLKLHPDMLRMELLGYWLSGRDEPDTQLVDARELLRSFHARAKAADTGEAGAVDMSRFPAITLLDRRVTRVRADGTTIGLNHVIRVVQSKAAADRLGEIRPPSGARLLAVRTIKPDGRVIWPERVRGKPDLSLSGLQPGDAVEYAWLRRGRVEPSDGGYVGGAQFAFWNIPVLDMRVEVDVAPELDVQTRLRNGAPKPQTTKTADGGARLSWHMTDLPPVPREPNTVSARLFFPYVDITVWPADGAPKPSEDAAAWEAIAEGYASKLARLTRPGHRVAEVVEELRKRAPQGPLNAAFAGFDWVKAELDSTETYNDFGRDAESAIANGKGHRTVVLAALVRKLGLTADILLCYPRRHGPPLDLAHPLPSENRFYYPVLRIGPRDRPVYADTSAPYNPFGVLPRPLYGARCLDPRPEVLGGEDQKALFTVLPTWDSYAGTPIGWSIDVTLDVDAKGDARGTISGVAYGAEVSGLRHVYLNASEDRQKQLWQQWVASILPRADVKDQAVQDMVNGDEPLVWELEVEIPGYFRKDGDALSARSLIAPSVASALAGAASFDTLAALPARRTPVGLSPHIEEVRMVIRVPEGMALTTTLKDASEDRPEIGAHQFASVQGRTLTVERSVVVEPARVSPQDYPAFRDAITRIVTAFEGGVTAKAAK